MWRREVDLQVGDMIQIGSQCVVVIEANDGEVTLKVCAADDLDGLSDWTISAPK